MAPPARKRVKREAEVPVEPESVPCYDFRTGFKTEPSEPEDVPQDAGQNAVTDNNEGASSSSGTFTEDVGNEFQNMLQGIKDDIKKIFHVRKMRFLENSTASIKTFNQKVEEVGKTQQEQRQKLFRHYFQDFTTFFQQWAMDMKKTKEEEEKLANLFHEHRKLFHQARAVQLLTQKKITDLFKEFLKSVEDLEKVHERFFTDENSEFGQEMAKLENVILVDAQQHDLAVIRQSLQPLLIG
ncbi:hypothetical protein mRhiFer1_016443 [Rhinolophus ferrumequinum]|uniref:XLR/SYCP3/FAM9 domain-containing protein n=1 Tax=Rhinolophus ferrumequinum TaxID=59479 RepID=A0A7J8AWU8_RHIFE|nr:hypothetical protein mRhiFer1_016443 [Rhinolophus ferrumequinum]